MIHIISDKATGKGLINIKGSDEEVINDFANIFEKIYEASPEMFILCVDVLNQFGEHLKEELKKNDQNDSSNESREQNN